MNSKSNKVLGRSSGVADHRQHPVLGALQRQGQGAGLVGALSAEGKRPPSLCFT